MKLFLALMASLLIHTFCIQWRTEPEITGSAGQAVLNIQQMRFITASAEPIVETNTDVQVVEDVIEEPISEIEPVIHVVKEQFEKPKDVIATLEKKIPQEQEIEKELTKQPEKLAKTNIDRDEKETKRVEKQQAEVVVDPPKEEKEVLVEIETEIEVTEVDGSPTETEVVAEQSETTAVKVVSTTDTVAETTGFDQIPTMEEPRYRKAFPPEYPRLAKKRGQQGLVLLRAKVDKQGEVEMVEVIASSGVKSLDARALETVEQWQFYPYTIANEATVAWVNIPVAFTLK